MPYIQIRSFPKDEQIKEKVAEKINGVFLKEWGCDQRAITLSFETVQPEDWQEKVMEAIVAPNQDNCYILSGQKRYTPEARLITGTHHVALKCADAQEFETVVSFYHELLELPVIRSWGEGDDAGIMLDTGNSIIEIFASGKESGDTGAVHHFALLCDDVANCIDMIRAAGYEITIEPTDFVIECDPPYPVRFAFCTGPIGETIEIFCEK